MIKASKIDRECACCHKLFKVYKSSTTKVCQECLHSEHFTTCLNCGKVEKYKSGSLVNFLKKKFCCDYCYNSYGTKKGKMLTTIYAHFIEPRDTSTYQSPIIKQSDNDIEEVISENCASMVLYQLYAELEPYYNECINGMKFDKYLPSTQQYLLDILYYIKIINKILRIEHKEIPVGQYADGRRTKYYKNQGDWNTGPTEEDLKHVNE